MKKVLLGTLAAAAVFASCNKQEVKPVSQGLTQITLGVPDAMGLSTRAGVEYTSSAKGGVTNVGADELRWKVIITHTESQTVVYDEAQAGSTEYKDAIQLAIGEKYTLTANAKFVSFDDAKIFNVENEDCYTVTKEFTAGDATLAATLKRPIGKLRLVATDYDLFMEQTRKEITNVSITYSGASTESFSADFNTYTTEDLGSTMFVDYLAGGADGAANIYKFNVTFTMADKMDPNSISTKTVEVTQDIPVKTNALTTVVGNIFTGMTDLTIKVEEEFDSISEVVYEYKTVSNTQELLAALVAGDKKIALEKGTYDLGGATIVDDVIIMGKDTEECIVNMGSSLYPTDKKVTFTSLTYNVPTGLNYAEGSFAYIHRAERVDFRDCIIKGGLRLNVKLANIDYCDFVVNTTSGFDGYALFYYGGEEVNVRECSFNTKGKAIVMYKEGASQYKLNVKDCYFESDNASTDKAAIQMHTEYGANGVVRISNTSATGFANVNGGLWNELNNGTKVVTDNFDIFVDGVKVH